MCLGVCVSGLLQMEVPVYMSARAGFPSSRCLCCGAFWPSRAAGSPRLTGRPLRSAGRGSLCSLGRRRCPAPCTRLRLSSPSRALAPGQGLHRLPQEGPAPYRAASPAVAGYEPTAPATALANPPPSPPSPHTSRLPLSCKMQPRGMDEGLGFVSDFRSVDCLPLLEGGSGPGS